MSTSIPPEPTAMGFRSLVDRLGAIVWEATPGPGRGEALFTFVSEGAELLLGYPAERWTADPRFWSSIVHPDDLDRVREEILAAMCERRGVDLEFRFVAADGRDVWVRAIVQVDVGDGDGVVLRGVIVDVSERRAGELRLRRLQKLTDALSGILDAREVAAVVARQGRAAVGAVAVAVFLRDGEELEISGYEGYAEEAIRDFCRIPVTRDVPAAEAARTGEPIVLDQDQFEARYPGMANWRKLAGRGQFVAIPLNLDGETLGSLAIRMPGDRPIDRADRVVLEVLARSCAQALQRARHVAAEREARAVLDTVIRTAPEGFALFDTDLRYVQVNDALAEINGIPAADHVGRPVTEVVPDLPATGIEEPLRRVLETGEPVVDLEVTGVAGGDPDRPRTWLVSYYPVHGPDGEIAYLGTFVVDITARKWAERRASVLAELGAILDEVVGVEERLARLVDALVPEVADVCTVSLRGRGGVLGRVAVRHVDRDVESLLASARTPPVRVEGTQVIDEVDDSVFDAHGVPPEDRDAYRRSSVRSGVIVPMIVRGRHLGLLALGSLRPRAFGPEDVELAEEVARRAALAVDNAQLYESERLARDRTARQYAVAAALADALTATDVAGAILAEIVPAVGADGATVWQVSEDGTAVERIGALGFAEDALAGHERYDLRENRPVAEAIRARRATWLATADEVAAAYPRFAEGLRLARVRSAAVIPLQSAGRAVGGLWLSARHEHAFDQEDRALAGALAAQAAQALERARLFEAERRVSVTLQRSLLPASLPEVEGVEVAVRYLPAAGLQAGGDFYEALQLPGGAVGLAVGDVVGRGAAAAATMGQLRSALRAFALVGEGPAAVLAQLSAFADTVGGAMAATAIVGRLRPDTGELCYACAGHPWPLLVRPDGQAEYLTAGRGVPLGCLGDPDFQEAVVQLEPGATILLYTDGLTERRGVSMEEMLERLRQAAAGAANLPLTDLLDCAVAGTGPTAPADDVALIAVRLVGVGARPLAPLRLAFGGRSAEVPGARAALRQWLSAAGVDGEVTGDLLLAAGEAVANAVEHSGTDEVRLEAGLAQPGVIEIAVQDAGRWKRQVFAPHRGRGFGLMRTLVDEISVNRGDAGTSVRLRRRVGPGVAGEAAVVGDRGDGGCRAEFHDGVAVLRGDFDLACAAEIRERLLGERPHTVDLTAVDYLDSTGTRTLLQLSEVLPAPLVVLAPPEGAPRRALDMSGLAGVFDVRDA